MTMNRFSRYLVCLLALLIIGQVRAASIQLGGEPRFPPADQVFRLDATRDGNTVTLRWYIQPGYYLYRHRLKFTATGAKLGAPVIPAGEKKQDEYFGEVEVYRDELAVQVPIVAMGKDVELVVGYQGCADAGYCYPPQKKTINVANL